MYVVSIGDYDSVESTAVRLNLHLLSKQVWNYVMDNDSRVCLFIHSGGQSQLLHMASSNGKLHVLKTGELKHCDSRLKPDTCPVQCNSVQDNIYVFGKAHNYALHPVSQTFPQHCLWNSSKVHLIDDGPVLSHPFKKDCLAPPLSMPLSSRRLIVPTRSVSSSLNASISHLWWLLCPPAYQLSHSPALQHVQGSAPTAVFKGGCWPWTHSSLGIPLPLFTFCNKRIDSVRMVACVVQLSPLEAIQLKAWWLLPPPLSSWRLRP